MTIHNMHYRTNSLFHYTSSKDKIIDILLSGCLYPNYCLEDLSLGTEDDLLFGIPEVCFCDIPLSRSQDLIDNYGQYALAFDKKWGLEHGCNPVMYISNPRVLRMVIHIVKRFKELTELEHRSLKKNLDELPPDATEEQKHNIILNNRGPIINSSNDKEGICDLLGYTKKYSGEWKGKEYCNYYENEWRFVLEDGVDSIHWLSKEEYINWRGDLFIPNDLFGDLVSAPKPAPPKELKEEGLRYLSFLPSDITHIVLKTENEVSEFTEQVMCMKTICGDSLNRSLKHHLLSKVTSFERIMNDY